jgi:hypothetical protein
MILLDLPMRITDHYNALSPNPAGTDCSDSTSCTATMTDPSVPIGVQCTSGACNVQTTLDSVVPNMVQEQKRAVLELGQVQVDDAGANGTLVASPAPASGVCPPACSQDDASTVFLSQGLFTP